MTGSEWKYFVFAGGLASVSRLASVMKAGKWPAPAEFVRAILQGLIAGLLVGLLSWKYVAVDRNALAIWLGICGLAGYGGVSLLDFLLELGKAALKRGADITEKRRTGDA